jgi:hypothetical protein
MSSRYDYWRPRCEACDEEGGCVTSDGWRTCLAHFASEMPAHRLFDRRTGDPIGPPERIS